MKIICVCILAMLATGCATTGTNPKYSSAATDTSFVSVNSSPVDTSSPDNSAQEAMQIQQMNDENALTASMQAAQQQNDAAVAATQQTETNAGF